MNTIVLKVSAGSKKSPRLLPFCFIFAFTTSLLPSVFAASLSAPQLTVNKEFNVISVNGTSYSSGLFSRASKIKLKTGINKIALQYEELFESDDDDDHDVINSEIFVIRIYLNTNQSYRLQYLKPSDAVAARKFASKPMVSLVDSSNKILPVEVIYLAGQSDNYVNPITSTSITKQMNAKPAAIILSSGAKHEERHEERQSTNASPTHPNANKMLFYWWHKANRKQRQQFLEQIKSSKQQ